MYLLRISVIIGSIACFFFFYFCELRDQRSSKIQVYFLQFIYCPAVSDLDRDAYPSRYQLLYLGKLTSCCGLASSDPADA